MELWEKIAEGSTEEEGLKMYTPLGTIEYNPRRLSVEGVSYINSQVRVHKRLDDFLEPIESVARTLLDDASRKRAALNGIEKLSGFNRWWVTSTSKMLIQPIYLLRATTLRSGLKKRLQATMGMNQIHKALNYSLKFGVSFINSSLDVHSESSTDLRNSLAEWRFVGDSALRKNSQICSLVQKAMEDQRETYRIFYPKEPEVRLKIKKLYKQ